MPSQKKCFCLETLRDKSKVGHFRDLRHRKEVAVDESDISIPYDITPMYNSTLGLYRLKNSVSFKYNKELLPRWRNFIGNVPSDILNFKTALSNDDLIHKEDMKPRRRQILDIKPNELYYSRSKPTIMRRRSRRNFNYDD